MRIAPGENFETSLKTLCFLLLSPAALAPMIVNIPVFELLMFFLDFRFPLLVLVPFDCLLFIFFVSVVWSMEEIRLG